MRITREVLVEAADVGLLQYRQVDPLLVYLLQHEVLSKRKAMLGQAKMQPIQGGRGPAWLSYIAGTLALVTAALFALQHMAS